MFSKNGLVYLWLTAVVLMADLVSKALMLAHVSPYTSIHVLPFFNVTLAYNTGAAFSFLNTGAFWPNILFSTIAIVASIVLLLWLHQSLRSERLQNAAIALILGGALGNLWDRIHYHHVIDFIDLHIGSWHWPVFNVADAAVTVGAVLMVWYWMRKEK